MASISTSARAGITAMQSAGMHEGAPLRAAATIAGNPLEPDILLGRSGYIVVAG